MKKLNLAISNLEYRQMSPVLKILQNIYNMAISSFRRKDLRMVRELQARLEEWRNSINSFQVYCDSSTDFLVRSNSKKAVNEITRLLLDLDKMLSGEFNL